MGGVTPGICIGIWFFDLFLPFLSIAAHLFNWVTASIQELHEYEDIITWIRGQSSPWR